MTDVSTSGFAAPGSARSSRSSSGTSQSATRSAPPSRRSWTASSSSISGAAGPDVSERRPWREDTLQVIFSGTKGLVAVCVLLCLERGLLELDESVSSYWPEFGKDEIRVRDVVSHRARLPGIEDR